MASGKKVKPVEAKDIKFKTIRDESFMFLDKTVEVAIAEIIPYQTRRHMPKGTPEVIIRPLIGREYHINRNTLLGNFTYANGKPISVRGWKGETKYLVKSTRMVKYHKLGVISIPKGVTVEFESDIRAVDLNGKSIRKASKGIIVCPVDDASQTLLRGEVYLLSKLAVRKMCVANRDEFEDWKAKAKASKKSHRKGLRSDNGVEPEVKPIESLSMNVQSIRDQSIGPTGPIRRTPQMGLSSNRVGAGTPGGQIRSSYGAPGVQIKCKYSAVGQIINNKGKRVGLILKDNVTEKIAKCPNDRAIRAARLGMISNVEAVKGPNGDEFLRGKGIQLERLRILREN